MSKWIDADALPRHGQRGGLVHWKDIAEAPSIDIVRCKECKWHHYDTDDECRWRIEEIPKDDDFCSRGERAEQTEPQTCEECEHWNDTEDGCAERHGCKIEPQTYVINPQEPTNDEKCFECDDFFTCGGQCNKIEDEPQTDCLTCRYNSDEWDSPKCDGCTKAHSNYEPQTDCAWK